MLIICVFLFYILLVREAILLEAKVMICSLSAESCSGAVLCLLSLLPGGSWLDFNSDGLGSRHFHFRKHGLPVRCFGPHCCVYPYLGLPMLDRLKEVEGFLVGTTNRMMVERSKPDLVVIDAEDAGEGYSLHFANDELKQAVKCTTEDKVWLSKALAQLEAALPPKEAAPPAPARASEAGTSKEAPT